MKKLDGEKIRGLLTFESEISVFDSVTSTNDLALGGEGIFFARTQTKGRGRMGRSFFSGEGGLYFSISLKVDGGEVILGGDRFAFSAGGLTVAAGIAVAKALDGFGTDARIKWVNDVYVGGKKVCGILAERKGERVAVGIGINVDSTIPQELESKAVSLGLELDMNELAARVINGFKDELSSPDLTYLRRKCLTIGKAVSCSYGVGTAIGVDGDGALIVDIGGVKRRLYVGEADIVE